MEEGKHLEHNWHELKGMQEEKHIIIGLPESDETDSVKYAIYNSSELGGMRKRKHIIYDWPKLEAEVERWSLHDEMSKLFNASLNDCFCEFEEEADLFPSYNKEHGDYNCQNVLTIWPKLRKNPELREEHPHIIQPADVGLAIMNNLPESAIDMIEGRPSVFDVGFVTFSLSPKWMAESIYKMLKDGINTWAPKLPVERVLLVKYPSLDEEVLMGLIRQNAIVHTLLRMLSYSNVSATMSYTYANNSNGFQNMHDSPLIILKKWFSIEERRGGDVEIGVEDKPPFILAKKDLNHLYNDLDALRDGFQNEKADWIVYVTPVRQQEYIEMCFTAAKLLKWTPTDRKWKWIPDGTSYVGYQTCNTEPKDLASLLDKVETCCNVVAQEDAWLLGYNAKAVFSSVVMYTFLKSHRFANCTFALGEMVGEEGNTFVYMLNTRAKIQRITNDSREDINELMKASELVLENSNRLGECEEHALEVHLLEFTVALKESCSHVSPHILCEYLYGLSKKFTNYYSSMREVGSIALLLCEATAIVMDKCFLLLGLIPLKSIMIGSNLWLLRYYMNQSKDVNAPVKADVLSDAEFEFDVESDKKTEHKAENKQMMVQKEQKYVNAPVKADVASDKITEQKAKFILEKELVDNLITSVARDSPRNSRFELFSIRPYITTDPKFEKGKIFGFIAVSDKYGLLSDGVSYLFEPDFAYVPLFNHEWCDPINMHNGEYIYLGNPSSCHSVAFSSSIEISMEIYVTTEKNAFELYSGKFKLDLLNIWGKNLGNECRCIKVEGEDGFIEMYYKLIKDAVDAAVEIRYKTETIIANEADRGCKVRGQIYAYYGSDILDHCRASMSPCYWALLFRSDVPFALEGDKIPLRKSVLAVPKGAPLKISGYLYDTESEKVILDGICELSSLTEGSSEGDIQGFDGTGYSLNLKVDWTYQAQYL